MKEDKRYVLIVEDDAISRLMLTHLVRQMLPFAILNAASVTEAKELVSQYQIDLALLDIMLEGDADGIELAEWLRQSTGVPYLFASANTDEPTLRRALDTHPLAFITKPYDQKALAKVLGQFLEENFPTVKA